MIEVKVTGKKATVKRKYDFPEISPLSKFTLEVPYEFELPLAGLDPKSPSAKRILSQFEKKYKSAVQSKEQSRNQENEKIWASAAKLVTDGQDPKKIEKATQSQIQKKWTEFFDKVLEPSIYDVICDLADEDLKANKIPRTKVSSFKDYFSGITLGAGLLGFGKAAGAAAGAATVGAAMLPVAVAAGSAVALLAAARKVSEDIYHDLDIVSKRIDKALEAVDGTITKLAPQVETLEKAKQNASANMIKTAAQIKDLEREFKALSAMARQENIYKDRIKMIDVQIKAAKDALGKQAQERKKLVGNIKLIQDLMRQSKAASDSFKADRSTYDNFLKHGESLASAIGVIDTVVGAIKKDEEKKK